MAVTSITKTISAVVKLNDGMDGNGNVKTLSVNVGRLNPSAFDGDKLLAIVNVMGPCLSNSIYALNTIEIKDIYDE